MAGAIRTASPVAAAVTGAWAGMLICIAAMAAPAAFAVLPTDEAGRVVARLFAQEAAASLALALLLVFFERRHGRIAAESGAAGSAFSLELMLVLGTMFCTVAGYYAVLPMLEAARQGQGGWSFPALHAISGGFFALKGLLVLGLVWRYARGALRAAATPS
jgi:hypothetical protein